jgi:hypothetical protein
MNKNIFIKYDQIPKYDDGYNVLSDNIKIGGDKKNISESISVNSNLFNNKTSDINYKLLNIHNMLYDSDYLPNISDTVSVDTYLNQTAGYITDTSTDITSISNYSSHKLPVLTSSSESISESTNTSSHKKTLKKKYELSS